MGLIGLILIIVGISFLGVTLMGWDNFLDLVWSIGVKFTEFISSGIAELRERIFE